MVDNKRAHLVVVVLRRIVHVIMPYYHIRSVEHHLRTVRTSVVKVQIYTAGKQQNAAPFLLNNPQKYGHYAPAFHIARTICFGIGKPLYARAREGNQQRSARLLSQMPQIECRQLIASQPPSDACRENRWAALAWNIRTVAD
jgi:hypothetical protein